MQKFLLRRLLLAIPTIVGATLLVFLALRVMPGDVLTFMFGDEDEGMMKITEEDRAGLIADLGLDKPLPLQYINWLSDIATGDFGRSFFRGVDVGDILERRGFISLEVAIIAVMSSWFYGLPLGLISAMKHNTRIDDASRGFAILAQAIPNFWLAALLVLAGVFWLGWSPPVGGVIFPWDDWWGNLQQVVPAGLIVGLSAGASIARMGRSTMLEVVREDYIRTARAKGLAGPVILYRHALKNAIIPVITISSIQLAGLLGGTVAVEVALNVPGLGQVLVNAINSRDMIVVQNLVFIYAMFYIAVNLSVDLLYGWLDPRIHVN